MDSIPISVIILITLMTLVIAAVGTCIVWSYQLGTSSRRVTRHRR